MGSRDLGDRIVAVLRQPFRIESLRPLIIEDVLEPVVFQKLHRLFEIARELAIVTVDDGVDVFLQQDFQQRTGSSARPRTKRTGYFRRKIAQDGNNTVRVCSKCLQKMAVTCRPDAG